MYSCRLDYGRSGGGPVGCRPPRALSPTHPRRGYLWYLRVACSLAAAAPQPPRRRRAKTELTTSAEDDGIGRATVRTGGRRSQPLVNSRQIEIDLQLRPSEVGRAPAACTDRRWLHAYTCVHACCARPPSGGRRPWMPGRIQAPASPPASPCFPPKAGEKSPPQPPDEGSLSG